MSNDWFTLQSELSSPPERLDTEATNEWRRITPYLFQINRLSQTDHNALAEYCSLWSAFREMHEDIGDDPLHVGSIRYEIEHPLIKPLQRTADALTLQPSVSLLNHVM